MHGRTVKIIDNNPVFFCKLVALYSYVVKRWLQWLCGILLSATRCCEIWYRFSMCCLLLGVQDGGLAGFLETTVNFYEGSGLTFEQTIVLWRPNITTKPSKHVDFRCHVVRFRAFRLLVTTLYLAGLTPGEVRSAEAFRSWPPLSLHCALQCRQSRTTVVSDWLPT